MASSKQHRIRIFGISLLSARAALPLQQAQRRGWLGTAAGLAIMLVLAVSGLTFMCTPLAWAGTEKVLHNFDPNNGDGAQPYAGLIFDNQGNLYGTTTFGGTQQYGTVFELAPNAGGTWTETVIHRFNGNDGGEPYAPVVFDHRGNLYGTTTGTANNNGTVFKLTSGSDGMWTESVLHDFTGGNDGSRPVAGVVLDNSGRIYGTTSYGGTGSGGVVFSLGQASVLSWHELVLHAFPYGSYQDGYNPLDLTLDGNGNIYGTTLEGGSIDAGTVFKLTPNQGGSGWTETVLSSFTGDYGVQPNAGVVFGPDGSLYGTATEGGSVGRGTVFKLTPNPDGSWTPSQVYGFSGSDGAYPYGPVVFDAQGNIYGTTGAGGPSGNGTVFKLTPSSGGQWTQAILYSFSGGVDGAYPHGNLVLDSAGNLYGTTSNGGTAEEGVVFEITP